jgi:hypothetical protein
VSAPIQIIHRRIAVAATTVAALATIAPMVSVPGNHYVTRAKAQSAATTIASTPLPTTPTAVVAISYVTAPRASAAKPESVAARPVKPTATAPAPIRLATPQTAARVLLLVASPAMWRRATSATMVFAPNPSRALVLKHPTRENLISL